VALGGGGRGEIPEMAIFGKALETHLFCAANAREQAGGLKKCFFTRHREGGGGRKGKYWNRVWS